MNNIKNLFAVLTVALIVSSFAVTDSVLASATIISAKLNGVSNVSVEGSALIIATVNVDLTNQSNWRSTAYRFGDGVWSCVDTPDHAGNTQATETFLIIAPAEQGTSIANFEAYENDNCANGTGIAVVSANLLAIVINILSLGTGETWLSVVLLIIIIVIASLVAYYKFRKNINTKTETPI